MEFRKNIGVIYVGITSRDIEVVRLLEKNMVLTAKQLSFLVFQTSNERSSLTITQNRLKVLFNKKQIKRYRSSHSSQYYYYIGKECSVSKHKELFGDTLVALKKTGYEILDVKVEYRGFYDEGFQIRPDMRIELAKNGEQFSLFVEVDCSKKFTNGHIYRDILIHKNDVDCLRNKSFAILSVCDSELPDDIDFKVAYTNTNFDNVESLRNLSDFIYRPQDGVELEAAERALKKEPARAKKEVPLYNYKITTTNGCSYIIKTNIRTINGVINSLFNDFCPNKQFKITKWELDSDYGGMNSVAINSAHVVSIEYCE